MAKHPLETLIKRTKHRMDRIQKELSEQQAAYNQTRDKIDDLKGSVTRERQLGSKSPELALSLGEYVKVAQHQIDLYSYQLTQITTSLEATRKRLMVEFAELKRYEIAYEAHLAQERAHRDHLERQELDEIAGVQHHHVRSK